MCTRSRLVYFVPFIVSFAGSAHGSRAVNIGANSVNKMTQAFVLSPRNERSEKKSRLLLSFYLFLSGYRDMMPVGSVGTGRHEVSL